MSPQTGITFLSLKYEDFRSHAKDIIGHRKRSPKEDNVVNADVTSDAYTQCHF